MKKDCMTEHFAAVRRYLDDRGIAYEVTPRLVRGLDYYTHTTFEFLHGALGAQNAICGGGSYNGLAESLGSKVPAPGIGFSIGEDRLVMAVEEARGGIPALSLPLFIAPMTARVESSRIGVGIGISGKLGSGLDPQARVQHVP